MGHAKVRNMPRNQQKAVFANMGDGSGAPKIKSQEQTTKENMKKFKNYQKYEKSPADQKTMKKLGILDRAAKYSLERTIRATETDIVELKKTIKTEKVLKKTHLKEGSTFKAKKNSEKIKKLKTEIKDWEKFKKSLIKDLNEVID